jgi:sporulation protein YlmC with PRC-barrel domain
MSMFRDDAAVPSLTGHPVLDEHHMKVGTVSDVVYDDAGNPRWAVVDPGPLRHEKFVPVAGSYVTESGELVIPYDKGQVKHAPKAPRDHVLDSRTEHVLEDHYEVSSGR